MRSVRANQLKIKVSPGDLYKFYLKVCIYLCILYGSFEKFIKFGLFQLANVRWTLQFDHRRNSIYGRQLSYEAIVRSQC